MAKILTVIPYSFYPPINGGSSRCFYILREMAKIHEVCVLTVQPEEDFYKNENPQFPANVKLISISNTKPYYSVFNKLPGKIGDAINYRAKRKKIFGKINSYFLAAYPVLMKALKVESPDIIHYENLEAVGFFSRIIKRHVPGIKQLYDSHNVDSELWKQMAKAQHNLEFQTYAANAFKVESNLYKRMDVFFCCSETDQKKLMALNKNRVKGWVIPNGVDTNEKHFDKNPLKYYHKEIMFCGSLEYYPNEEGLLWFYSNVFTLIKNEIPEVVLTIVGNTHLKNNFTLLMADTSVKFEGRVADVQPFYHNAGVCIAPLLTGSGTRLKILEAMSFGNPVVSTSVGAEGIKIIPGKHILIADQPEIFAQQICSLLQDKNLFDAVRNCGRDLVTTSYDWNSIGIRINDIIKNITENNNANRKGY